MDVTQNGRLVSVVLPTYNGRRHLSDAIGSCLNQTWTNFELIVVDDHSTDETPGIIERYAAGDPRVRYIRHDRNRKLPAALNSGFKEARGEYLTWTSDDNCYLPRALETMVGFLDRNEKIDIVCTEYSRIDEEGAIISKGLFLPPGDLGYRGNVITPCFLFRRRVYDSGNGYAEDLFLAEDYYFWLCAAETFSFGSLGEDLYHYREHAGALSSQQKENVIQSTLAALERALGTIDPARRSLRAGIMVHAAAFYFECGQVQKARKLFVKALRTAPLGVIRRTKKGLFAKMLLGERPGEPGSKKTGTKFAT